MRPGQPLAAGACQVRRRGGDCGHLQPARQLRHATSQPRAAWPPVHRRLPARSSRDALFAARGRHPAGGAGADRRYRSALLTRAGDEDPGPRAARSGCAGAQVGRPLQEVFVTRGAGGPVYSDKPQPGSRTPLKLPELNVMQPGTGRPRATVPGEPARPAKLAIRGAAASAYRRFSIVFPEDDGSVAANTALFEVRVAVEPALQLGEGHAITVSINGRPVQPALHRQRVHDSARVLGRHAAAGQPATSSTRRSSTARERSSGGRNRSPSICAISIRPEP
jgi:hypothetical protein